MGHDEPRRRLSDAQSHARQGNLSAAFDILRQLLDQTDDLDTRRAAAVGLISLNSYSDFRNAADTLAEVPVDAADQSSLVAYAYAAFALGDAKESIHAARAAIARDPKHWVAMKTLGMSSLLAGRPAAAAEAFSAAMRSSPDGSVEGLHRLAQRLSKGDSVVELMFDGERYRFALNVDTPQMIEAALIHLQGSLGEAEELRAIGRFVPPSASLVEIGTLVGNHLIYLLKTLKPSRAFVFDYDERSIQVARANAELNAPYPGKPDIAFKHTGLSRAAGQASGPRGYPVNVVALDDVVLGPVDFMKIDVDGLELEVLAGATRVIREHRPKIMIEVARVNDRQFCDILGEIGYRVIGAVDRQQYKNYLIEAR